MNKKDLVKILEKYHLGGLTEQVKLKIKDKQLLVNFATNLRDCIGEIKAPFDIIDAELGIYNTTQLLKLINVTNELIELEIVKKMDKAMKLNIQDNQFDLSYNLSDLGLISEGTMKHTLPEPKLVVKLTNEFITKFIKAHNALEKSEKFQISSIVDKQKTQSIKFSIGEGSNYSNKITFTEPVSVYNDLKVMNFSSPVFREIISNNKNAECMMYVYDVGVAKIDTIDEDITTTYYIIANK